MHYMLYVLNFLFYLKKMLRWGFEWGLYVMFFYFIHLLFLLVFYLIENMVQENLSMLILNVCWHYCQVFRLGSFSSFFWRKIFYFHTYMLLLSLSRNSHQSLCKLLHLMLQLVIWVMVLHLQCIFALHHMDLLFSMVIHCLHTTCLSLEVLLTCMSMVIAFLLGVHMGLYICLVLIPLDLWWEQVLIFRIEFSIYVCVFVYVYISKLKHLLSMDYLPYVWITQLYFRVVYVEISILLWIFTIYLHIGN